MINHKLLRMEGILILTPEAPLESADFERLAQEIDPYIEANGKLHGVMIDAESFPGWNDFAGLIAHLRFVRNHHHKVQKIAVVSDSSFLSFGQSLPAILFRLRSSTSLIRRGKMPCTGSRERATSGHRGNSFPIAKRGEAIQQESSHARTEPPPDGGYECIRLPLQDGQPVRSTLSAVPTQDSGSLATAERPMAAASWT